MALELALAAERHQLTCEAESTRRRRVPRAPTRPHRRRSIRPFRHHYLALAPIWAVALPRAAAAAAAFTRAASLRASLSPFRPVAASCRPMPTRRPTLSCTRRPIGPAHSSRRLLLLPRHPPSSVLPPPRPPSPCPPPSRRKNRRRPPKCRACFPARRASRITARTRVSASSRRIPCCSIRTRTRPTRCSTFRRVR